MGRPCADPKHSPTACCRDGGHTHHRSHPRHRTRPFRYAYRAQIFQLHNDDTTIAHTLFLCICSILITCFSAFRFSVPQVTSLPAAVPSTAAAVPGAPAAGPADVMQTQLAIQQKLASFGLLGSAQPIDNPLDRRIYVGSLHYELKQADVQALFSCFGTITKLDMSHDPTTNKSKGYCFIEFSDIEAATAATAMDGFELANRKVCVR